MLNMSAESFREGFIEPPLIKQLQNILKEYPDDGQILKELIQNAEDAGAKTVKFLYDHNQYPHDDGTLYHKGLAAYQGPALYAYNDAVFSDEDWKGIRMIQDSVKSLDPMKVGRFGLGFKSVFHMTDLPGIISGKQVGFLDPQQFFFKNKNKVKQNGLEWEDESKTSSYAWKLSADLLKKHPNQFKPFMHDIFNTNEEAFESENFDGTIFRFPLRKNESEISQTIYNDGKISNLIEILEKEGHLLLLFLKHLERIEFLELFPGEENPELKLSVEVSCSEGNKALVTRQHFVKRIKQIQQHRSALPEVEFCNYVLQTKLLNIDSDFCESKRWAVTQYYGGGDVPDDISILASKSQNIPLVGVALPLDANVTSQSAPSGSVFCFLPMPLGSDNETGLNVHVNGYFAVDHNRQHLKWPSKHQSLEHSTDEDLMWNISLLKYFIPCAMKELLHYAILLNNQDIISVEQVYAIFPSKATLKNQWLPLLATFREKVIETTSLYSASTETWIIPTEAYLINRKDAQFKHTIKTLLINGKLPLCEPPSHVIEILQESVKDVTSSMLRTEVMEQVSNLTRLQKQDMIKYFYHISSTTDLMNLELLELLDGTYQRFDRRTRHNVLYLETEECRRNLFPTGIENILVNYKPSDEMYEILQNIAHSGKTQLSILQPNNVAQLIQRVFKGIQTYSPNSPPLCISQQWLRRLWSFISKYNLNLKDFIGIPMMPMSVTEWGSLSHSIPYIVDNSTELSLSDVGLSSEILEKIGCKVLKEWNNVAGRVTWERIGSYASPPTIDGILKALIKVNQNVRLFDKINNLNENEKMILRNAISNENSELELDHKRFLKKLPLIKCYKTKQDKEESWCSFESIKCFAELDYNIPLHYKIGKWEENKGFAIKVDASNVSQTVVLKKYIFPKLNEKFYTQECIQTVMEQVLQNLHQHDANILQDVEQISFLTTQNKNFLKPCEVLDPSDEFVRDLFQILDVFPHGKFADRESIAKLEGIFRKVSEHDVLELIKYLNSSVNVTTQMLTKGEKLLQYLSAKGVNFLSPDTYSIICKMKWLPAKVDSPYYYPEKVGWFGKESVLYSPKDIFSAEYENVVGSVKPVLIRSLKGLNQVLLSGLKLNKLPSTECIISHLENIRAVHTQFEKKDKHQVTLLMKEIYQVLNRCMSFIEVQRLLTHSGSWIWNGDTFTTGAHVVLDKAAVDTNPYVSSLPEEYAELKDFFLRLNVQKTIQLTDVLLMINDYHQNKKRTIEEKKRDLNKCLDILRTLSNSEYDVPTQTPLPVLSSDDTLKMASLSNCAYCDQDMWKKWIDVDDLRKREELYVVHEIIPPFIAKSIGVPSLTSKYLNAEPIAYGQSEPLTRRISRLLDDYKDGISVLKELLKNADDAGARKVAFIYDCRDFRSSSTSLIDKNMKELQGPALLIYNDAQFTDEDFANIVKLSGETKKENLEKVGRFGLGFNAVYNLTDAPSFISNHSVVMLDPHVKYLSNAVQDATQPGIRLHLTEHGNMIRRFRDQFKPFENIMGVDLQKSEHYSGTLFRLPLRTPEQAEHSLISNKSYGKKDIQELFELFQNNAKNILLFTQNVIEIDFYEIPDGAQQPVICGHLQKSLVHLLHSVNTSVSTCGLYPDWNDELKILKHAHEVLTTDTKKSSSYIMKTEVELNTGEMFAIGSSEINYWLISAVVGNGESRKSARQQKDILPVGGIAVELKQQDENEYQPLLLKSESSFDGQVFCFLPLPIKSELPFHINGFFAVESNRRQLCEQQCTQKRDYRAYWNQVLMEDAVTEAFVQALCDMVSHKSLFPSLENNILELFPISIHKTLEGKMNSIFTFMEAFYTILCQRPLDILHSKSTWMGFNRIHVLSPGLRYIVSKDLGNIGDMICATCKNYFYKQSTNGFVDLPKQVLDQMLSIDSIKKLVESKMITLEYLYSTILLDSETAFEDENFHGLIRFGLLESDNKVDNILRQKRCIPVAGSKRFLQPNELVDPGGPLRDFYDDDDNPFPVWLLQTTKSNLSQKTKLALVNLGMRVSDLPEDEIICQAKTVQFLSKEMGTKRCTGILQLLDNKLKDGYRQDTFLEDIKKIPFLPIAEKPQSWPFPWQNDHHDGAFILINAAYSTDQSELVGCSEFIASFPLLNANNLQERLGYGKTEISFSQIERQIDCIVQVVINSGSELLGTIESVMDTIYHYLDSKVNKNQSNWDNVNDYYKTKEIIMIKYSVSKYSKENDTRLLFVTPQQCALVKFDPAPYLFSLPNNFREKHWSLVQALEITDTYPDASLTQALADIEQKENQLVENGDTLSIVGYIAKMLARNLALATKLDDESSCLLDVYGPVYLPDSKCIMTSSINLCFNNCPWISDVDKHFLHESIPFGEAEILGVKTFRKDVLSKFQSGIPFGQSEKLTNRIQRILEGYTCDKEIMNELLQNADDCGATEVHFILDPRTHAKEKLFEPTWEPLQGPALLVYNDQPFTETHLKGIQNLGEGSKSNDPLTTGKYGVGFNCVYHLTDTPMFLTTVKEGRQTLVAFDPQCKYVPGCDVLNPGQMWENVEEVRHTFPDVFECYQLPFETAEGTLFRFPLRTEGTESDISDNCMNEEKILELFKTFSESIHDALLFVNNVKKVTLSKLDHLDGSIETVDQVELNMTMESQQKKDRFTEIVQCAAQDVTAGNVENILLHQAIYEVDITHQHNIKRWLVVQQIGLKSQTEYNTISDQYRKKKAKMLPRGGVAYLLSQAKANTTAELTVYKDNKHDKWHTLFCSLPLPVKIEYPMHVNGNFVLDHESRRNLRHDENENGLNVSWNKLIMQKVVAPCYSQVMEYKKENIAKEGKFCDLQMELQELIDIFPHKEQEEKYMKYLEKSIFEHMMLHETELLPVLIWKSKFSSEIVNLHWFPLCSEEKKIAYFDSLNTQFPEVLTWEQRQVIRNVLHNCRFPITLADNTVLKKIKAFASESNQTAEYLSPENVLKFLILKRDIFQLPIHVTQSVFGSRSALINMLDFVKEHLDHLENVPLLLKANGFVHMFKTGETCLLSDYSDLVKSKSVLFADKIYLSEEYSIIKGIDAYIKPLTCANLAPILQYQLPRLQYYGINTIIQLHLSEKVFIRWLIQLWAFIDSQCNGNDSDDECVKVMHEIKPLEKWCILPVKRNSCELWPLCHIEQLVNLQSVNGRDKDVEEILKKMSFPHVYIPLNIKKCDTDLSAMKTVIEKVVSNLSRPDRVLIAFGHAISKNNVDFSKLTALEGRLVLTYFSDSITMLAELVPNAKFILMNMPLYETQCGDMLSLSNTQMQYYIMPEVPSLEGWTPNNQKVYLKTHSSLDGLHKYIDLIHLNKVDAYLHHILDYLTLLDDETRDKHLYFLKTVVQNPELDRESRQMLLDKMKYTPMLKSNSGTLLTVSEFYDDVVPLFRTFESIFPMSPYNEREWKPFLREIGLIHRLNVELVLKYAKSIEQVARNSQIVQHTDLHKKSKLLYQTIVEERWILNRIAASLKKIAFLPTEALPERLLTLCEPHTEDQFVKLYQSALSKNAAVIWTQCPILISWVDPNKNKYICDLLGVKIKLTLQEIVNNLKAVIDVQLQSLILVSNVSENLIGFLQEVFHHIINDHEEENVSALTNMRCIPVNQGTQLVYPTQITLDFPVDEIEEHVTPYLCKIPIEFCKYKYTTLLLKIGASQTPTAQQYANVLTCIYDKIPHKETALDENELNAALYALQGLFQLTTDDNSISTLDELYLLTNRNCLVLSEKLVFIDKPRLRNRITDLDSEFISNEKKIGKSQVVENALKKLSPKLRPTFLSDIVTEYVDAPYEKLQKTVKCLNLEVRLASKEFANGVLRIMRTSENEQGSFSNEEDDAQDLKLIQNLDIIKVYELDEVNSYLVHNGQRLPNSDENLSCFLKHEPGKISIILSADSLASNYYLLCSTMCLVIDDLLKHKLEDKHAILLLNIILNCPVEKIDKMLDDKNVKPYDTNKQIMKASMPNPGEYVPLQFHHLLQQRIELLTVGEYVAFELYDPLDAKIGDEIESNVDGDGENAVYCYARVTRTLTTEGSYCNYHYEIDIDSEDEKVNVHASELYRVSTYADEDVPDAFNVSKVKSNYAHITSQIRETLEIAWELEERVKRKVLKRLFLQWHPDKNTECIELARDVFKYIQHEIDRLEQEQGRSEIAGTTGSSAGGSGLYGFNFYDFFSGRARSHRRQRDQFEDDSRHHYSGSYCGDDSSSYTTPRDKEKNPQPDEARRWMRQAEHDLLAVPNDMGTNCNEWACFKAHQAAEKGLKATQFANDADLKGNHHFLPSLCNAIDDDECLKLAYEFERLVTSSVAMRYPDRHHGGQIPHDAYSDSAAKTAKSLASQILEKCQAYIISQSH